MSLFCNKKMVTNIQDLDEPLTFLCINEGSMKLNKLATIGEGKPDVWFSMRAINDILTAERGDYMLPLPWYLQQLQGSIHWREEHGAGTTPESWTLFLKCTVQRVQLHGHFKAGLHEDALRALASLLPLNPITSGSYSNHTKYRSAQCQWLTTMLGLLSKDWGFNVPHLKAKVLKKHHHLSQQTW